MNLLLVRHAMPAFGPDVPAPEWELSSEGRCEARALARVLPPDALLVASREPKARQTLEPAGSVYTDARFDEVARDEPYEGDFRARRRAYVTGTDYPGWEPRERVAARFAEAVSFWAARAEERPLVIASHGMAMTVWLAATVALADPGAFWADLRLPDLLTVDMAAEQVSRSGSADPPPIP
ncbi:Broad specificity phosphatase PhoE [Actinoplanes philippinensis]|uniref:Broad specificity phosphatase PhoE n=1 Tax=Actinoplanes philippinensis TaxID=35752 RepID=A0A1I2G735_9ACTN|nr:Broad specificity phosphatase PhoE [Actinoplanes philippinensis]